MNVIKSYLWKLFEITELESTIKNEKFNITAVEYFGEK
jgi:hypothetical protein